MDRGGPGHYSQVPPEPRRRVNRLEPADAAAQLSRGVARYRPRFVTLRLTPAR